jgi:multidrug efflux pump subunit AcrA (membrane-fusion protein)
MGKRPAGARHLRTSAKATASPAPGFPRVGRLTEVSSDAALDGLLDPQAHATSGADHAGSPAEPGLSEADQAALDLDAILSMAFGMDPEPVSPPAEAEAPVSDDFLDDLFGELDLGAGSEDTAEAPVAEVLAGDVLVDADDPDAPPAAPRPANPLIEDAEVISATVPHRPEPPAPEPQAQKPSLDDDFDLAEEELAEPLPDLNLDDIFGPIPAPLPRARARGEDFQPPKTPSRDNRRPAVPELDRVLKIGGGRPTFWRTWLPRLFWTAILAGLIYVAFLPYPYEVGGDFVVQPLQRSEARSRTDGEIIQVNVREGDWVKEGDILAVLSNWDELREVAVNESDDAVLRANLATMENGAKPEEIAVAREAVTSAELLVSVTQTELDRQQALFDSGTIAEKVLETARNAHAAAVAARDEAAAKLALVASPTPQTEIDAQKAAIARNQQELDFARLMLEYANIRAPQDGQIVSSLSEVPVGAYLPQGGLFAELENNRTVIAEVDMPETYIHEVSLGAPAELRLWSDPETSIFGTVRAVAPRAEERDFGWVIRVEVEVPNPDGRLAANMTGFGKVAAAERPVWQAFTEAIVGFFKIELWSWVP